MQKTSGELEKEFIDNLKSSTGKDLAAWIEEINSSGITKRNDIINWLKSGKIFGHMNASLLTGIYFNNGNPVYGSETELLNNQFEKFQEMKSLYQYLQDAIMEWDNDAKFIAKKTYVSVTKKREFAAINIKKGELRVGFDLGGLPFDGIIVKTKLTGPMPRISHMTVIKSENDIGDEFFKFLKISDGRVNSE